MNSVALDSFDLHVYQPLGRVCGRKRESTMTDSLFWLTLVVALTALLWMPYILEFISRVGLLAALFLAEVDPQNVNATPEWAERMKKSTLQRCRKPRHFRPACTDCP
jgi:hypothetical protein